MKTTQNPFNHPLFDVKIVENLKQLGYTTMTPIQEACIPVILEQKDVTAKANTGTGKTVAFGLPLLAKLNVRSMRIQSLILCPTRELAEQVAQELRRLARCLPNIKILALCGGSRFTPQVISLEHGAHVVVGTPGRILQHIDEKTIDFSSLKTCVLDEADRMLDMGFFEDIEKIISTLPSSHQTLLFSATFPPQIQKLCEHIQKDAHFISVDEEKDKVALIEEHFYRVDEEDKKEALTTFLLHNKASSIIIFCKTKIGVIALQKALYEAGFDALSLHGDLEQMDREEHLVLFANGSAQILVATDVASRGLDIKDVEMIINYDVPTTVEVYTHRIGRSGRMGKKGVAISLISPKEEPFVDELGANVVLSKMPYALATSTHLNPPRALFVTVCIDAGKKQKLRAGDILGVLTKDIGLEAKDIGKITILDTYAYVAIARQYAQKAFDGLCKTTIKNRRFRIWKLG